LGGNFSALENWGVQHKNHKRWWTMRISSPFPRDALDWFRISTVALFQLSIQFWEGDLTPCVDHGWWTLINFVWIWGYRTINHTIWLFNIAMENNHW
jgi:hypothetical protein